MQWPHEKCWTSRQSKTAKLLTTIVINNKQQVQFYTTLSNTKIITEDYYISVKFTSK